MPNDGGRVIDQDSRQPVHGAYVAGWIKRGPTGFIGTNKSCAQQTVQRLVDDFNAGLLRDAELLQSIDLTAAATYADAVPSAQWTRRACVTFGTAPSLRRTRASWSKSATDTVTRT